MMMGIRLSQELGENGYVFLQVFRLDGERPALRADCLGLTVEVGCNLMNMILYDISNVKIN